MRVGRACCFPHIVLLRQEYQAVQGRGEGFAGEIPPLTNKQTNYSFPFPKYVGEGTAGSPLVHLAFRTLGIPGVANIPPPLVQGVWLPPEETLVGREAKGGTLCAVPALCLRCAKSRLFSTTSSHGSQGP